MCILGNYVRTIIGFRKKRTPTKVDGMWHLKWAEIRIKLPVPVFWLLVGH